MTTALAGIALEHCTQLKWELVGLGIAHVAAERLSHDGESHLLSGNIFPLEKIHFQAISPDTKRRPAHPATKHRVNLAMFGMLGTAKNERIATSANASSFVSRIAHWHRRSRSSYSEIQPATIFGLWS